MCKVQLNFAYPAGARKVFSTLIRVIPKLPNNMKNNLIGSILALCLSSISIIDSTAANVYPENPFLHLNQDAVEYFNISMDMSGYKFNSSDLTGKDIIDLFALIGPPQKKSGWIEYVDDVGNYLSRLFSPVYSRLEIPIKAYAWDTDEGIFVCLCTYNDVRFQSFPLNFADSGGYHHYGTEWLALHSTDEDFKILVCFFESSYNEASTLAHLDVPKWVDYNELTPMSIYDFYLSKYELQKYWTKKNNPIFRGRTKRQCHFPVSQLIGISPFVVEQVIQGVKRSYSIEKKNAGLDSQISTWMICEILPDYYYIDRYDIRSNYTSHNDGYIDVVHWDNEVKLIVYHSYEPILVEY